MTVFVGPKRALLGSVKPAWVTPGSVWTSDFSNNRYYRKQGGILTADAQLVTNRASVITLPNAAGVYSTLGNNSLPRTDRGLYVNGQVASKTTGRNNNLPALVTPTDAASFYAATSGIGVLSASVVAGALYGIVDLAAEVEAAGLAAAVGNGRVFVIDNTAGASNAQVIFSGEVGNTNGHTVQIFAKGTGNMAYGLSSGFGSAFSAPANWTRLSKQQTPGAGTNTFGLYAAPGSVVYFILFATTETSFLPDPVILSPSYTLFASGIRAVQGTRPSNAQPEPFPGWEVAGLDDGFSVLIDFEVGVVNTGQVRELLRIAGASPGNDFISLRLSQSGFMQYRQRVGGGSATQICGTVSALPAPGRYRAGVRFEPGHHFADFGGLATLPISDAAAVPNLSAMGIGSDLLSSSFVNNWLNELQICKPLSDAQLLEWVNT